MVHLGIRRCVSIGFGLWISPGRLALRSDRGNLVGRRGAALVAGGKLTLMVSATNRCQDFLVQFWQTPGILSRISEAGRLVMFGELRN
jgi:hypothetical protein